MDLTHREIIAFLNGRLGRVANFATIPPWMMARLQTTASRVALELDYATKLRKEHSLLPEHFYLIQTVIQNGWIGQEANRPRDLVFLYYDRYIFHKEFKLVIKSNGDGNETWIKTYFKLDADDVPRTLRKCRTVRDRIEEGQP